MEQYPLNGAWEFREAGTGSWDPAQVPGCNYGDLLALKKIPDPFVGENEEKTLWVAEKDWEYRRAFSLPDSFLAHGRILLACAMLDTLCDVYVNDTLVGKAENVHIRQAFDCGQALQPGENVVRIVFFSPLAFIEREQAADKSPHNNMGLTGGPHIRKAQCHFGWDWGPILPISGITGDISLLAFDEARLHDMKLTQEHRQDGAVDVTVTPSVERWGEAALTLRCELRAPDGSLLAAKEADDPTAALQFTVEQPQLWWTNELSDTKEQPLYTVKLTLSANGAVLDTQEKKLGLRTIALNREPDAYGTNFQFVLNGVPIFAKGANYIPPDSLFPRFTAEDRDRLLRACVDANMNMIRVWGGGYYETDEFYDMCDRYGILVWQDFGFACQPYPFYNEAFLENVKREVADNVRRLRHHASLALWCGNNELEVMSIGWKTYRKLTEWTKIFFYDILPGLVREQDEATPFISGSPIGTDYMKGFASDNDGDTHRWQVWHGLQNLTFYRKCLTRFCSEFGLESMPSMETIRYFSQPEDWSLTSRVFNAHQKSPSGNKKMLFYIAEKYRIPTEFSDLVYLSQMIQYEGVRDATEHWRRNRGRCNGSLYWQLNDCWPVNSWAGVDYLGRYKALHYGAKRFLAPQLISIEDTKKQIKLVAVNDRREPLAGDVCYRLIDFHGKVLAKGEQTVSIPAVSVETIRTLDVKKLLGGHDRRDVALVVELLVEKKPLARQTYLFVPEKDARLPCCDVKRDVSVADGVASITVSSDVFARSLYLESDRFDGNLSDNFFDLLPNEPVTLTVPVKPGTQAEELTRSLSIQTIANMTQTKSKAAGTWTRLKILALPINFFQWIYYRML